MMNKIKKTRHLIAKFIVSLLLVFNLIAYSASHNYFTQNANAEILKNNSEEFGVLKMGWQLIHWSYSLLNQFKSTPPPSE
jgi:hypothetical protein